MHNTRLTLARSLLFLACAACGDDSAGDDDPNVDGSVTADEAPVSDLDAGSCKATCGPGQLCSGQPLESYPALTPARDEWRAMCADSGTGYPQLIEGTCKGGDRFLYLGLAREGERLRYFKADGTFVATVNVSDHRFPPCQGKTYWPEPPACEDPTVAEVFCGSSPFHVGDKLPLMP